MFVHTDEGRLNLAHVARIKNTGPRGGKWWRIFYGANGERLGANDDPDLDIETLMAPIVPAAPGTTVVLIYHPHTEASRPEPDDIWVETVPVLAWRCTSLGAVPIIFEDEDLRNARILHPLPDGRFLAPGDRTFETVGEAVASALQDAQEAWDLRQGNQVKVLP